MTNSIHLNDLVEVQKTERYKAIIILGNIHSLSPNVGSDIASALEAKYISIVDEFVQNQLRNTCIDTFDPDDLKNTLRELVTPTEEVVVLEGIDMLWTVWSTSMRNRFLKMIEMNTISPYRDTVFIFLILKDDQLMKCDWKNDAHHSPRVMDINEILLGGPQ
ncbi:hypothetical protein BK120_19820 [Paenibacillus sp. FSL A5-0031]|uniref:hypothetical protein n=1 Tax=Paenibacillus sp. FSL A5-0031 TaxID=1920420 RepID=UPI00096F41E0|nr:hypothetical protein [Paenibacillus sp. FSL A5-0031]OME80091.1 hypothetical protein BK120_19820 [Paenibacillus sp. FSL A5-0031]